MYFDLFLERVNRTPTVLRVVLIFQVEVADLINRRTIQTNSKSVVPILITTQVVQKTFSYLHFIFTNVVKNTALFLIVSFFLQTRFMNKILKSSMPKIKLYKAW